MLVNSNPETVSTDFDTTDRLYFEPLDSESVRDILENEATTTESGEVSFPPSIVQFGGQTAIDLSQSLDSAGLPILGSTARSIDTASDRYLFEEFLSRLDIPNPPGAGVSNVEQALTVAQGGRLPDSGAPQLRARRPGHGDRAERHRAGQVHGGGARKQGEDAGS